MSLSLFVIVPGFGGRHITHKIDILHHNLKLLSTQCDILDTVVFNYTNQSYNLAEQLSGICHIEEKIGPGIIGQFLYKYVQPITVAQYDYVLILLDDIKLIEFDLSRAIKIYKKYSFDILSPGLTKDSKYSYHFMIGKHRYRKYVRQTNMIELFCYLMSPNAYNKYYSMLDENSRWLWGIDHSLHYQGFKCGIIDRCTMKHYYKGESYCQNLP